MQLDAAIEVFVRGYAFMRSRARPCVAERIGPVWVVRDALPAKQPTRVEEWVATDVAPAEVDRLARRGARGLFKVCAIRAIQTSDAPLRASYKKLGYRLAGTEPLFVHDLKRIGRSDSPVAIERLRAPAMADRLAEVSGSRQILIEQLRAADAPIRQYVALDDAGEPIGWVQSIVIGDHTYVSNMKVLPEHRRRGIGRALLAKMLRDDRAAGARASALLASHTGAMFYPAVGYRQIGELLLFVPSRSKNAKTKRG